MKAAWIQLILKLLGKVLTIFKVNEWLKNKWVNRKKDTMGLKQISGGTQVVFTVKSFAALIGTILTIFFGFYQLVFVPRINTAEAMFKEQKDQNAIFYQEIVKVNTSIGTLQGTVEALMREKSNIQPVANTGGSFGGGNGNRTTNGNTASVANH